MKSHQLQNNQGSFTSRFIYFTIVYIASYFLMQYNLFIGEDCLYAYIYGTTEPIKSISDIIISQYRHYQELNGRFLVHVIVQLFCGLWGIEIFRIINSLFFTLLCGLITRFVFNSWKTSILNYIITTLLIFFTIPAIKLTILGNISFSVNYLWTAVFNLLLILLIKTKFLNKNTTKFQNILLLFICALCGSLQESFSIPILGATILYITINVITKKRNQSINQSINWAIVGYSIGTILLIIAPGNFIRLSSKGASSDIIGTIISRFLIIFSENIIFSIFIIIHLLLFIIYRRKLIQFISKYLILYLAFFINISFALFIAYIDTHQLFFSGIIIILLTLFVIKKIEITKCTKVLTTTIIVLFIPIYIHIYNIKKDSYKVCYDFINRINIENNGNIPGDEFIKYYNNLNSFENRYSTHYSTTMGHYLSLLKTGRTDMYKNMIPCKIDKLIDIINKEEEVSKNIWFLEDYYCYVIRINESITDNEINIYAQYPITSPLSLLKRKLKNQETFIIEPIHPNFIKNKINYSGYNYIFYYINPSTKINDIYID